MWHRSSIGFATRLALVVCAATAGWFAVPSATQAQIVMTTPAQAALVKLDSAAQGIALAEAVRGGWKGARCAKAAASLEENFNGGVGGWLVQCVEGTDYWVMIPAEPKRAAIVMPCILARVTTGNDCYANLRTLDPGSAQRCGKSPFPDRAIGACTAIIQSGRLADKAEALSIVYQARGMAFARYQQVALALSDFDRAVELNPRDPGAFYNRAVALERKGDLDQAIRDLDESLRLRPENASATYERGYAYLRKRDYDHAISDFDQTIRLDPKSANAYRERSAAWKAKGDAAKAEADAQKAAELDPHLRPPSLPPEPPAPAVAPSPVAHELSDADRQVAYCMEASFGYTQQYARLVARIRQNTQTVGALLDRPDISAANKDQIRTQLKSMTDAIPADEAAQKHWQANGNIFIEQLKRRGLLDRAKFPLVATISQEVGRDQQAVTETARCSQR
jgi:tetratricopeptide (TPR) repeat protein